MPALSTPYYLAHSNLENRWLLMSVSSTRTVSICIMILPSDTAVALSKAINGSGRISYKRKTSNCSNKNCYVALVTTKTRGVVQ